MRVHAGAAVTGSCSVTSATGPAADRWGRLLYLTAAFALGVGLAAGCTAFGTYLSRYSSFDALYGEIDDDLYLQITRVSPVEWVAVQTGAVLMLLAAVLFLVARVWTRRTRMDRRA